MSRRRTWVKLGVTLIVLASAGCGIYRLAHAGAGEQAIPTARVQRGTVELNVNARGELRPERSAMITAPPVYGSLQIIRMSSTGALVKAGEIVLEFDPSEQEYNLEQNRSKLQEAEQQIAKARAETAVQVAQDEVALLKARFDVRRAELEVQKNELVSDIDARKNRLALDEAHRRLEQLQQDVRSRRDSNAASVTLLEQQRNQAKLSMMQAQRAIENMKIKAPISGLVSIKGNEDASGGFWYPGMVFPEYKAGDQVYPGRTVMEVLDIEHMEVATKIDENDRANISPGQNARIMVDLAPSVVYRGKLKSIAGAASGRRWSANTMRSFDATLQFQSPDSKLRPGAGAQVVIEGSSLADKFFIPRQCVFEKNGRFVVYVRQGSRFEPREVKISTQSESRAVVEGIPEGTEVALLDPTAASSAGKPADNSSAPLVTGK
jgi:multidrug resistance efflux pump